MDDILFKSIFEGSGNKSHKEVKGGVKKDDEVFFTDS